LTGEGIGLALESGRLAAETIERAFTRGDFYSRFLAIYSRKLRRRYGELFFICNVLQKLFSSPVAMNTLMRLKIRRPILARGLARVFLTQILPSA
jgi:flavin-dependent dehydrogenase